MGPVGETSPTTTGGMGATTQSPAEQMGSYGATGVGQGEGSGAMQGNAPIYAFQNYDPYQGSRSVQGANAGGLYPQAMPTTEITYPTEGGSGPAQDGKQ